LLRPLVFRAKELLREIVYLLLCEDLESLHLALQLVEVLRVRPLLNGGLPVVGLEGVEDVLSVVLEIKDEGILLAKDRSD
jgi:hypothetical protein